MHAYKSFETERLFLRPASLEDAAFVLELLNTEQWIKYIGDRNVHTIQDAENYIKNKMAAQFKVLGFGSYTIIRKADEAKIGNCGLYNREGLEGVDIGFALLPQYAKQGYAFEAANKLKAAASECFGLKQICAITLKENTSSQKLLEKLGLRYSKLVKLPLSEEELILYQLNLASE